MSAGFTVDLDLKKTESLAIDRRDNVKQTQAALF